MGGPANYSWRGEILSGSVVRTGEGIEGMLLSVNASRMHGHTVPGRALLLARCFPLLIVHPGRHAYAR
jgi:hypothetical protein